MYLQEATNVYNFVLYLVIYFYCLLITSSLLVCLNMIDIFIGVGFDNCLRTVTLFLRVNYENVIINQVAKFKIVSHNKESRRVITEFAVFFLV